MKECAVMTTTQYYFNAKLQCYKKELKFSIIVVAFIVPYTHTLNSKHQLSSYGVLFSAIFIKVAERISYRDTTIHFTLPFSTKYYY